MDNTIGILGGMGPEATAYLFHLLIKLNRVENDQNHIPIIIYNNPKIPDRTAAIVGDGESPLPFLIEGASFLEKANVDFILIPCITAHYFYEEIIKHINIPIIHLLEETLIFIKKELINIEKIGLLASDGTIQSGLFQDLFEKKGIEVVTPREVQQQILMKALYQKNGVKAGYKGHPRKMILKVVKHLLQHGAEAILAGCTEIPLVLNQSLITVPFINPLEIAALESIRRANRQVIG